MKKILLFCLILITLFSVAIAEHYKGYCGTWFFERELKGPYYHFELFHFFEDGSGYYVSGIIDKGDIDDCLEVPIIWEQNDSGVRVLINKGYQNYTLLDDGTLSDGGSFAPSVFCKLNSQPPYTAGSGFTVPSGVYIAGEDFPAGTYRIEMEDESNTGVIVLYENMEDTKRAFSYLHEYSMTKKTPVVGKMVIEPGNVLDVRNTIIILLPYEGLK